MPRACGMLLCACRMNPTRPRPKVWHARRNVGDHQVRLVTRQGVLALAFDHHLRRGVHRVGAQRIQARHGSPRPNRPYRSRAKIGAGGGTFTRTLRVTGVISRRPSSHLHYKSSTVYRGSARVKFQGEPHRVVFGPMMRLAWLACQSHHGPESHPISVQHAQDRRLSARNPARTRP